MNQENAGGHLIATKLGKSFQRKGQPPAQVLSDFDLEIEPGKLTVIMGSSGCGKSTLAYILAGFIKPDSGTVVMDGQPVTEPGPDRVLVFQETALWPWMSVIDNVMFGPLARGEQSHAEAEKTAMELLERFGLVEFRDRYPGQRSGGLKRRAEIAQALVNHPRLMILDEPFRGLDEMTRELMQEYYLGLFEDSPLTTLFITSELEEAIFLADRILIMGDSPGRIIATIDVDLPHPRNLEVTNSQAYLDIKRIAMEALYSLVSVEENVG
jgi:NitT/TauT family transport system ATP-binding protein